MKIAMISPNVPPNGLARGVIGGGETYAASMSTELAKLKQQVTLITASKNEAAEYHVNEHLNIKYFKANDVLSSGGQDPFSVKIIKTITDGSFDLVHVHQVFTAFNLFSCGLARIKRIPSFATDHGGGTVFYRGIGRICANLPNYFITVSNYSARYLYGLAPQKKSFVAYGGVDTDVFNPNYDIFELRKSLGLEGFKVVLCVGRLLSCKGYDVVIKAFSHLQANTKLLIVGPVFDQYYYNYLVELSRPFGSRVVFVGGVEAEDLPKYYNLCDVFVRTSVNHDCFGHYYNFPELLGLVKLEAMACGKPVVVSDVGGLPEIVVNGKHGYIVKERAELETAKAIDIILSDEKLARRMGQNCLRLVQTQFSWRKVAERVLAFYRSNA